MDPIKLDVNKTTTFLLPILFPNSIHDEIFSNYFKQAYIGLLDDEMPTSSIVLEFDDNNITPDVIEDFLKDLDPQADLIEIKDNLVFLDLNKPYQHDAYDLFLRGKYSEFNEDIKKEILSFWKEEDEGLLYGILHNKSEIVDKYTPYLNKDIIGDMKETNGESWPMPNLFADEFLVP